MVFSKSFPREVKGSAYPKWEETEISDEEEKKVEEEARKENTELMKQCIDDAKKIIQEKDLKEYQTDLISMAISLFEKRASHIVYWKESKCKEKFDKLKE